MRCLALAQAWRDRSGRIMLLTTCRQKELLQLFTNENCEIIQIPQAHPHPGDAELTMQILGLNPSAWLVMDGYHLDDSYQRRIKENRYQFLYIDDMGKLSGFLADILLNQNIHAREITYTPAPDKRILLGPDYILLRREFLRWRDWVRPITENAGHILVTLGGGDHYIHTVKVLEALQELDIPNLEVTALTGIYSSLSKFKKVIRRPGFRLLAASRRMPELMAWADLAITGGGSTVWESAFMGLPSIIIVLAENQVPIAQKLSEKKAAVNLGWCEKISVHTLKQQVQRLLREPSLRRDMSNAGRKFVDGKGPERVITEIRNSYPQ